MAVEQIRVLVVEDSQTQREVIEEWLAEPSYAQFHVESCDSLAAAMLLLGSSDIDAVLLDLVLPDSEGLDTCVQVLQLANGCPVVVLSSLRDEYLARNAVRYGAQDYLVKGEVDARALRRAICYAIERTSIDQDAAGRTPTWDAQLRELRLGQMLVKRFRQPSSTQELILKTFQEEGWPQRIDDPLPPVAEHDPKIRLRTTIKSLNRNQHQPLLRFHGDGTGQAVLWELLSSAASARATAALP